jgi:hypothetical protein
MKKSKRRSYKSFRKTKRGGVGNKDPYNLIKINTINNLDMYRFTIDGCFHYFYNNAYKHVYIATKPPVILDFGEELDVSNKERIFQFMQTDPKLFTIVRELRKYNMAYYVPNCFKPRDLSEAHHHIDRLNTIIRDNNCDYKLTLDYVYNTTSSEMTLYSSIYPTMLVLCLNIGNKCISSIILATDEEYITISSKTKEEYQGRKYNTLLRCVTMIIARALSPTSIAVWSTAINPISAYLLVQKFDGIIQDNEYDEFIQTREVPPDLMGRIGMYKTYIESTGESFKLDIHCPLNVDTFHKNNELFPVYLDNSCT